MNAIDPTIDLSLYTKKVEDEQLKIQNQLDSNQKERTFLKGLINNMLTATVMSTTSNQLSLFKGGGGTKKIQIVIGLFLYFLPLAKFLKNS